MKQRKLAFLLAFAMILSALAACGGTTANEPAQSELATSVSTEAPAVEPSAEAAVVSSVEESEVEIETDNFIYATYPLVSEPTTFTVWITYNSPAVDDFNTQQAVMTAREITGVTIDYKQFAPTVANEQFNLMVASGDYTDMIHGAVTEYNGGGTKAVEDDVLIDLLDIAQTYAPNFMTTIANDKAVYRDCINDDGYLLLFPSIYSKPFVGAGYAIRQDWLDALDLDTPVTYDDWTDTLRAFKDSYGCSNPLWMTSVTMGEAGQPTGGFDVVGYTLESTLGSDMYQVDGTVHSSFLEDGYREYIELLHQWYEDGLISKNFTENTADPMSGNFDQMITTDQVGIWYAAQTDFERYPSAANNPDFTMAAIPSPVKTAGQENHFGGTRELVYLSKGYSVTTACEDPELAVQWMDFWYTEEGTRLANFGTEGISYNLVNGKPQWTDLLTSAPSPGSVLATQTMGQNVGTIKHPTSELGLYLDAQLEAEDIWTNSSDGTYYIPSSVQLTSDEGDSFSALASDYETYASEVILKFIIGEKSMDEWDSFVDEMIDMGIEDAVALYQAALDRYYAR
jgi:putative aldouronate transport system substrate-binding protein